jgi:hypothetical protein
MPQQRYPARASRPARTDRAVAVTTLQTSSGSIRNVPSLSNVTHPGAAPIFTSTVRPIAVPDGTVMVRYGTYDPFVLVRSVRAVERVVGIGRVAVDTNIAAITAQLDLPFRRVMARLAQRL